MQRTPKTCIIRVGKHQQSSSRQHDRSAKKSRPISGVTSVGSFVSNIGQNEEELTMSNIKSRTGNPRVSSPSRRETSVVHVSPSKPASFINGKPRDQQQSSNNSSIHYNTNTPMPKDMQTPCFHNTRMQCTSKTSSDQISKRSPLSLARVCPSQTTVSVSDFDPRSAKILCGRSFNTSNNSCLTDRTTHTMSDRFVCDKNDRQRLYTREEQQHRRRRKCAGLCSPCCCLLSGLLLSLLLAGLTALITTLILSKTTTRTTITTTTTTTSATTITTTATTSSTSTSTSTSTTSTSVTTVTTTTTTAAATTVTITSNTCTSGWGGATVYSICNSCPNMVPYIQYTYSYVAIANRTRITFAIREDVGFFALDSISVRSTTAPTVELLTNGGFDVGSLSNWTYCNPAGSSYSGTLKQTSDNFSSNGQAFGPQAGSYYYVDGAVGQADYISQMFATDIGGTYNISFWLFNYGTGSSGSDVNVIISI